MKPSAAAASRGGLDLGARARRGGRSRCSARRCRTSSTEFLADDGDLVAERGERQRAEVVAVEEDAAAGRVVEPRQQVEDRRLAGAGAADEGDALAGLDREGEAVEGDVAVGIGEMHVLEADLADGALDPVGAVDDGVLGVEEHEDPVERRGALLDGGEVAAEPARAGRRRRRGRSGGR